MKGSGSSDYFKSVHVHIVRKAYAKAKYKVVFFLGGGQICWSFQAYLLTFFFFKCYLWVVPQVNNLENAAIVQTTFIIFTIYIYICFAGITIKTVQLSQIIRSGIDGKLN